MKKLIIIFLLLTPALTWAQGTIVRSAPVSSNPAASNYNKQVLTDANLSALLTLSIPVVTTPTFNNANPRVGAIIFATQDSSIYVWSGHSWLKSGQGGGGSGDTVSFTHNFKNLGTVTNAIIDLADTINTKKANLLKGVFSRQGNFIQGDSTSASQFAVVNFTRNSMGKGVVSNFATSKLFGGGASMVSGDGTQPTHGLAIFMNKGTPSFQRDSGNSFHQIPVIDNYVGAVYDSVTYTLTVTGGGGGSNLGNSDLTQNDPTRTFTIGTGDLIFTGTNAANVNTVDIGASSFFSDITDGTNESTISLGAPGSTVTTNDGSGRSSFIGTNTSDGTSAFIQSQSAGGASSKSVTTSVTGANGIIIHDAIDNFGLTGDALFDVSSDPNQYVQFGNIGSSVNTIYNHNGIVTSNRTVNISSHDVTFSNDDSHFGISGSINLGAGAFETDHTATGFTNLPILRADEISVSFGINSLLDANQSTAMRVDTVKGYYLLPGTRGIYQRGLQYSQLNFTNLRDSSLIPRKYAITLMDSVKSTISGGTGTVISITPGVGFLSHTPITTSGTMNVDTASTIAAKAYVNNFGTKAFNAATYQPLLGFTAENSANKSNTTTLGTSTTLYPTQNAVKVYVDNSISGITGFVPTSRTITVNGVSQDLSANRTYTITTANTDTTSTGFATRLLINNYLTKATAASTYALQTTTISAGNGLSGGGSLAANRTLSADTSILRTVLNSYSLSGMATKLANYFLKTDTTAFAATLVHINKAETIVGPKTATALFTGLRTALGTTTVNEFALTNTTPATLGAQQITPSLLFSSPGWSTTNSASRDVSFKMYSLPVQGAANPTGLLHIQSSINAGAPADAFTVDNSGNISNPGTIISNGMVFGNGLSTASTNGATTNVNFVSSGTSSIAFKGQTATALLMGGASAVSVRTYLSGGTASFINNGDSYIGVIFGTQTYSNPSASSTLATAVGIKPPFASTDAGGTVTDGMTLLVQNGANVGTNKWNSWFKGGFTRVSGLQVDTLTASMPVATDASKRLISQPYGTFPQTSQTTTYAILANDFYIDCNGTFTVTLPTAVGKQGKTYTITNTGVGTITIATTSAQTINGLSTATVTTSSSTTLHSDNANWFLN